MKNTLHVLRIIVFFAALSLCLWGCSTHQADDTPAAAPTAPVLPSPTADSPTKEYTVEMKKDVVYKPEGHNKHKLDVYLPEGLEPPFPTLLLLHGGYSDKTEMRSLAEHLVQRGFAVVAPNRRDMPEAGYPAPVEDAFCALGWLVANAGEYGFKPERGVVGGHSAGGTLAAMLAAVNEPAQFTQNCPYDLPDAGFLRGAISFTGVFDFSAAEGALQSYYADYLGVETDADPLWVEASPVTWLDGSGPPFLLIH
ncbi:MAG: alpha/beta hydrolase, partial [Chloroflexi bacterium]|nr:alpha/beta hydrolase [Chloroflexota bacterium]